MVPTEIIAAVELSSSKISGIAGHRNDDGSMQILAYATEPAETFVRKGTVYNVGKAALALTSIINKMEEQLKCTVARVYVGIGGQSLRTVENKISRVADTEIVSQELIDGLTDENLSEPLVNMDILDVVPQEYEIDNHLYAEPVGVTGHSITGRFLNIVALPSLKKNLEMSFSQAKVEVAELLTAPLCLGRAVLTEHELRAGCALVDLGADTTTVAVYKNQLLRYLCVLPLGGTHITRDLTYLQIEEDEAEQLKCCYGDALYREEMVEDGSGPVTYTLGDGRSVLAAELNDIIGARAEEILANVWNQVKLSGYEDKLTDGFVLTGGGSNLRHIGDALLAISRTKKVRIAPFVQDTIRGYAEDILQNGTQNTLLALLFAGHDNCCRPLQESEVRPVSSDQPLDMFRDDEDLKILEEENRKKKKAEEERAQKEKEEEKRHRQKKPKESKPNWFQRLTNNVADELFGDNDMKM